MSNKALNEHILRPSMPELDSIRGLAIIGVIIYHGFYTSDLSAFHGWQHKFLAITWCGRLGVNLFFVLSGFLISGLLWDSRTRPDYYQRFYVRRARRILPAYIIILVILFLLDYPPKFLVLSAFYLSNLTPLFGIGIAYSVLWTLAVEEHFYFVWPFAVKYMTLYGLFMLCIGIIFASPFIRFVGFHFAHTFEFNNYTWNSLDGLACGAAAAIFVRIGEQNRRYLRVFAAACLAAALFLSPFAIISRQSALGAAMQIVPWQLLFTGALGGALLAGSSKWKRFVQVPALAFFGRISYGLYLVHMLLFQAFDKFVNWRGFLGLTLHFCCASSVAILVAWLSREYFEERFLPRHGGLDNSYLRIRTSD